MAADREKPPNGNDVVAQPTKPDEQEDFRPEGAEWEPAGGLIQKPPVPEEPQASRQRVISDELQQFNAGAG